MGWRGTGRGGMGQGGMWRGGVEWGGEGRGGMVLELRQVVLPVLDVPPVLEVVAAI